jgi:glycosyltransferase involved in cell wall biosynthesis
LLVTIGQAKKGMALQECFEALAALPPRVHLALVGKNYEEYLGDLQLSELKNRVHLVQPVKPFEVTPFVKSADASLILYYPRSVNYENFLPNGLFQSIAAELPILYPNLSEIKNIAESYKLGISINPRLPNSISEAVMMLMDNPDLRAMYRQNARRAMQDLNWEKEEAILRELVFEVLGSEPSRRLSDETLNRV